MDASEHLLSSEKLYEVFIQHCITLKVSKYVEVFLFWIVLSTVLALFHTTVP